MNLDQIEIRIDVSLIDSQKMMGLVEETKFVKCCSYPVEQFHADFTLAFFMGREVFVESFVSSTTPIIFDYLLGEHKYESQFSQDYLLLQISRETISFLTP